MPGWMHEIVAARSEAIDIQKCRKAVQLSRQQSAIRCPSDPPARSGLNRRLFHGRHRLEAPKVCTGPSCSCTSQPGSVTATGDLPRSKLISPRGPSLTQRQTWKLLGDWRTEPGTIRFDGLIGALPSPVVLAPDDCDLNAEDRERRLARIRPVEDTAEPGENLTRWAIARSDQDP